MRLEAQELKCMDCGKKFSAPGLGDFNYGSFIFVGEKGNVFGRFQALGNPTWDFIDTVLKENQPRPKDAIDHGSHVQNACAHFADAIKGQRLCNHHVCPRCCSTNVEPVCPLKEMLEVPVVTHTEFLSLPEAVRRQRVLEFHESTFLREAACAMFKEIDREEELNTRRKPRS